MKIVITGATGMVGGIVLKHCLEDDEIKEIISITRRSCGIENTKLKEIILDDFTNLTGLEEDFSKVDIAYFCLGVYTGAVPDDQFKKITVDYTVKFADFLKANSSDAKFCFLSGSGADQSEKSRISFAKYKGMAENHLIKKQFTELYIFRPGYIYPVDKREEPNFTYKMSRALYPLIKLFGDAMSIKSTALAYGIFKAGREGAPKMILENKDIVSLSASK